MTRASLLSSQMLKILEISIRNEIVWVWSGISSEIRMKQEEIQLPKNHESLRCFFLVFKP